MGIVKSVFFYVFCSNLLSLDVLATHLAETWTLFLQRVKFSGEDYLSLHHLSFVLKIVAEKGELEAALK